MRRSRRRLIPALVIAVLLAACGGDDDDDGGGIAAEPTAAATTAPTTVPTQAPGPTPEPEPTPVEEVEEPAEEEEAAHLAVAERILDAFYSFDPGALADALGDARDAPTILFYQGWADGGNDGGPTPADCARAVVAAFADFVAERDG